MKRLSTGTWASVAAAGAFVLCLSLCAIVRSCELAARADAFASLRSTISEYWNAQARQR